LKKIAIGLFLFVSLASITISFTNCAKGTIEHRDYSYACPNMVEGQTVKEYNDTLTTDELRINCWINEEPETP